MVLDGVMPCDLLSFAGRRARERLEELLLHRHVQMEDSDTDVQGRIMAKVWADGEEINTLMAKFQPTLPRRPEPSTEEPPESKRVEIPVDESLFKDQGTGLWPRSPGGKR